MLKIHCVSSHIDRLSSAIMVFPVMRCLGTFKDGAGSDLSVREFIKEAARSGGLEYSTHDIIDFFKFISPPA